MEISNDDVLKSIEKTPASTPEPAEAPKPATPAKRKRRIYATRSLAQRMASRTNGAKSKGPVTPEGKKRSSQNGVKYGLYATESFLIDYENPEVLVEIHAGFTEDYQPQTFTEETIVTRLAHAEWNRLRYAQVEAGLLERGADDVWNRLGHEAPKKYPVHRQTTAGFEEVVNRDNSFKVMMRRLRDAQREIDACHAELRRIQKDRRDREREKREEQRAQERHEAALKATADMTGQLAGQLSRKMLKSEPGSKGNFNDFSDAVLFLTDEFRPGMPPKLTPQQEQDLLQQPKSSKPDRAA